MDDWVHIRNGPYKGDLARVLDVEFSSGRVTVKVGAQDIKLKIPSKILNPKHGGANASQFRP